jgi:Bifunctional DNA primase/polymerase, N-terminal
VTTPRGGQHYWFLHPGGDVASNAGQIAPRIDVRADGGYVVAPPSPGYVVDDAPGSTTEQLAEAAGLAPATMKHKLRDALEDGLVTRAGTGKKGDPFHWHPPGRQEDSGRFGSEGLDPNNQDLKPLSRAKNGGQDGFGSKGSTPRVDRPE